MGYKRTDALMRHLRDSGVSINGTKQKRQLINTGYITDIRDIDFLKKHIDACHLRHMMKYMQLYNMILN